MDLYSLFSELAMCADWNTAPGSAVTAIANLHGFYVKILRLCRNGVLPRERMRTALCNLNDRKDIFGVAHYKWNFDSRPTVDVAHSICGTIRVGTSKLRDLKQSGKRYIHAMLGQGNENCNKIDELIDMITLANSPKTEAMVVARQFSYVDDTGCCMEVFDRVLSGALCRPLRNDSSTESLVGTDPGVEPTDMRSSEHVATTDLDTQTTAENEGSVCMHGPAKREPDGVDTAHGSTIAVVAEQTPVTPHPKASCMPGNELDRPSAEKTEDAVNLPLEITSPVPSMAEKKGTPRKMVDTWQRHIVTKKAKPATKRIEKKRPPVAEKVPTRILVKDANTGKDPKRNYMCRAYKKAYQLAKGRGRRIPNCKLLGRKAYADAGAFFDKYVKPYERVGRKK